jgi:hypothetical protein
MFINAFIINYNNNNKIDVINLIRYISVIIDYSKVNHKNDKNIIFWLFSQTVYKLYNYKYIKL